MNLDQHVFRLSLGMPNVIACSVLWIAGTGFLSAATLTPSASDKRVLELTFEDEVSTPLRTPEGGGVAGRGHAFDNTASSKMGGNSQAPGSGGKVGVAGGSARLANARSFTVQGWYKSDAGQIPSNYARLLAAARINVFFDSAQGKGLSLSVNRGSALCPDAAFRQSARWVFFAITYDGTQKTDNVLFYAGSENEPVRLVGKAGIDAGPVGPGGAEQPIVIGNVDAGDRPFDGLIDNIRLWADTSGTSAILDLAALEQLRKTDAF
ncbi:LamG-like jellyroll fold domain-containing protein [Geminisphaera colitermitum]|uniref:LamG-like jellyroll fold domain-containing protein n=1 Tax=Geminisphaera colitermitum TaxID=1148786 RepID=UPI000158CAE2|nr:LamG-like jellyroll fold domain-containing protein [Geminisphaera colitermitum]